MICGDTLSYGAGLNDVLLVLVDSTGGKKAAKAIGDADEQTCGGIALASGGGFYLTYYSYSSPAGMISVAKLGAGLEE